MSATPSEPSSPALQPVFPWRALLAMAPGKAVSFSIRDFLAPNDVYSRSKLDLAEEIRKMPDESDQKHWKRQKSEISIYQELHGRRGQFITRAN